MNIHLSYQLKNVPNLSCPAKFTEGQVPNNNIHPGSLLPLPRYSTTWVNFALNWDTFPLWEFDGGWVRRIGNLPFILNNILLSNALWKLVEPFNYICSP